MNASDNPDSQIMRGNRFDDTVYETFDNLWKNKDNDALGQLLFTSLDKLAKNRSKFCDKINKFGISGCSKGQYQTQ